MNTQTPSPMPSPAEPSACVPERKASLPKPLLLCLVAALALTFWLYAQAEVVIMLSEQLWLCF